MVYDTVDFQCLLSRIILILNLFLIRRVIFYIYCYGMARLHYRNSKKMITIKTSPIIQVIILIIHPRDLA